MQQTLAASAPGHAALLPPDMANAVERITNEPVPVISIIK
jgi:hypothetical protein